MVAQRDESFESILAKVAANGNSRILPYSHSQSKEAFLHYLVQEHHVLLHGSNKVNLALLEPNQATGVPIDQALKAIYATDSAAESIFFAILRKKDIGSFSSTTYGDDYAVEVFGKRSPWQSGIVYILSRDSFEPASGYWVSRQVVRPMASLKVDSGDFPYLQRVRLTHLPWYDKWVFRIMALWKYRR